MQDFVHQQHYSAPIDPLKECLKGTPIVIIKAPILQPCFNSIAGIQNSTELPFREAPRSLVSGVGLGVSEGLGFRGLGV